MILKRKQKLPFETGNCVRVYLDCEIVNLLELDHLPLPMNWKAEEEQRILVRRGAVNVFFLLAEQSKISL